jgi:hypothetical protein
MLDALPHPGRPFNDTVSTDEVDWHTNDARSQTIMRPDSLKRYDSDIQLSVPALWNKGREGFTYRDKNLGASESGGQCVSARELIPHLTQARASATARLSVTSVSTSSPLL